MMIAPTIAIHRRAIGGNTACNDRRMQSVVREVSLAFEEGSAGARCDTTQVRSLWRLGGGIEALSIAHICCYYEL